MKTIMTDVFRDVQIDWATCILCKSHSSSEPYFILVHYHSISLWTNDRRRGSSSSSSSRGGVARVSITQWKLRFMSRLTALSTHCLSASVSSHCRSVWLCSRRISLSTAAHVYSAPPPDLSARPAPSLIIDPTSLRF